MSVNLKPIFGLLLLFLFIYILLLFTIKKSTQPPVVSMGDIERQLQRALSIYFAFDDLDVQFRKIKNISDETEGPAIALLLGVAENLENFGQISPSDLDPDQIDLDQVKLRGLLNPLVVDLDLDEFTEDFEKMGSLHEEFDHKLKFTLDSMTSESKKFYEKYNRPSDQALLTNPEAVTKIDQIRNIFVHLYRLVEDDSPDSQFTQYGNFRTNFTLAFKHFTQSIQKFYHKYSKQLPSLITEEFTPDEIQNINRKFTIFASLTTVTKFFDQHSVFNPNYGKPDLKEKLIISNYYMLDKHDGLIYNPESDSDSAQVNGGLKKDEF